MTLWKSLYRNTTQEIINARKQKKKSSGKVYLNFLVIVCAPTWSRVISGQPIFLPRDANFRAKLPSATKSLVTRLFSAFLIRDTFNGLTGKNVI